MDVLHDGSGAAEQARAVDYDVVVLDLMLPGQVGIPRSCATSARARRRFPWLILTAKDSIDERVAGLDGGAGRLHGQAVRARRALRAAARAARRGAPHENVLIEVRDLAMDTVRRSVERCGRRHRAGSRRGCANRFADAQCRAPGHQVAHHRARVGHPLRHNQQRRRGHNELAQEQEIRSRSAGPLIHTIRGVGYCTASRLQARSARTDG